jgi:pseudouridine-5'-phosphate glycosidase
MIQLPQPIFFVRGPRLLSGSLFLKILAFQATQWGLGMTNGVLFGVPIPASYAAVGKELQEAVERAVKESQENGINRRGKEVTPWLLDRVRELTSGKSLASSECASYILLRLNEWPRLDRHCTY